MRVGMPSLRKPAVLVAPAAALATGLYRLRTGTEASPEAETQAPSRPDAVSQRRAPAASGNASGLSLSASGSAATPGTAPMEEERTPVLEHPATPADGFAEVRVRSADQPVRGARVVLYWRSTGRTRTPPSFRIAAAGMPGGDGIVRLPARAGAYLVSAHAPPLAGTEAEFVRPAGAPVTRVELKLAQAYVLQ